MARFRRNRRRRRGGWWILILAAPLAVAAWWLYRAPDRSEGLEGTLALGPQPALTTDRPEASQIGAVRDDVSEKGATTPANRGSGPAVPVSQRAQALINAGRQALERDDPIAARTHFSEAMILGVVDADATLLRAELTRIGDETIFSNRIFDGDPFVERYVIQPGDSLAKIASANNISADLLAAINNIADKNRIRAGRTMKIVKGPFLAVIHKRDYSLDVYLARTFVKHFRVGLGADDSTPTGEWRVATKLMNPTYYPPRGGEIIPADDPRNPLGERWIGLVGVSGEAVGQQRYGVHGTNEPETIGQSVSMGCVRMYNEDVESLYSYLVSKHSTVTVLE